jgi:hypothetical protein
MVNFDVDKHGINPKTEIEKEEWYEKTQVDPNLSDVFTLYWNCCLGNPYIKPGEERCGRSGEGNGKVHAVAQRGAMAEDGLQCQGGLYMGGGTCRTD